MAEESEVTGTAGFMGGAFRQLGELMPAELVTRILSALVVAAVIAVAFNILQIIVGKLLKKRVSGQRTFIIRKAIKYTGFTAAVFSLLAGMGIDASALLGAAGIIGIAVGFAAQTTVSSFISGFFLLSEKPFGVGDVISVDTLMGEVLSVDVLSVKIRTFDNLYVRIPNETLFKSNLVNLTRFPIRRLDISFPVSYKTDIDRLKESLERIASENHRVLKKPAPLFRLDRLERTGPLVNFTVWFESNQLLETRTEMFSAVQRLFASGEIEAQFDNIGIRENVWPPAEGDADEKTKTIRA